MDQTNHVMETILDNFKKASQSNADLIREAHEKGKEEGYTLGYVDGREDEAVAYNKKFKEILDNA